MATLTVAGLVVGLPRGGTGALVASGTTSVPEEHDVGVFPTATCSRFLAGRGRRQVTVATGVVVNRYRALFALAYPQRFGSVRTGHLVPFGTRRPCSRNLRADGWDERPITDTSLNRF